jgi:aryl-alcohol dehydrogenase (NADP+)
MAQMRYRVLGSSGLRVSELSLGTMMFGGPTDEAQARRIVDHATESGVNFIDTADVYADGRSEAIVGPAIKARRDRWVLATKVAQQMGPSITDAGLSRRHLMRAVEASLQRLQTDHIDLYYIHRIDPRTPWESTVSAFGDLIRQGKIREWGLSNVRAWHIPHVVHLCRQMGVPQPTALQPYYNPHEPPARD